MRNWHQDSFVNKVRDAWIMSNEQCAISMWIISQNYKWIGVETHHLWYLLERCIVTWWTARYNVSFLLCITHNYTNSLCVCFFSSFANRSSLLNEWGRTTTCWKVNKSIVENVSFSYQISDICVEPMPSSL